MLIKLLQCSSMSRTASAWSSPTLHDQAEEDSLKVDESFVVCDAGGGTVDLISYRIKSLNPLRVEECAIGDGGLCGSVWLDIAFEKAMIGIIGSGQYASMKPINRRKMMKSFEMVKRAFDGNENEYMVDLKGVDDNEKEGILDEYMILKVSLLRTVFDFVCGQIDKLVQKQVLDAKRRGNSIKALLLVGGFGTSKYLHRYLERSYMQEGIRVLQVNSPWSAIARGACMWGLEHCNDAQPSISDLDSISDLTPTQGTVAARISKYSYGFCANMPFNAYLHPIKDKFRDNITGQDKAKDQMTWLLRRGEVITSGKILTMNVFQVIEGVRFWDTGSRSFATAVFYSDMNIPPSRKDDGAHELCRVSYQVPESKIRSEKGYSSKLMRGRFRNIEFNLIISLDTATLKFKVMYKNISLGSVEAEYKDEC